MMTTSSTFDSTLSSLGISRYGTTSSTSNSTSTSSSSTGTTDMDMEDFLTLFTAQLQNQDPFDPVDNSEMVSQMAQLSQVSGISDMNTTLSAISDKMSSTSLTDALGYVGKTVLTEGSSAYPSSDGSLSGAVTLSGDATDVTVTIKNSDGDTLKTLDLGEQASGAVAFTWDGTTDSGDAAGDGPFTIEASATGSSGSVTATPLVWSTVASVSLDSNGSPVLTLPALGQVSLDAVWQVA